MSKESNKGDLNECEDSLSAQYRYDPFLDEWIIFAPHRGSRPFQGKVFKKENQPKKTWICPFCPDAPEGAGEWIVKQLPNKFAALNENAPPFIEESLGKFYKKAPNFGKCEVILYSKEHNQSFGNLDHENIVALVKLWIERYTEIQKINSLKFIYIMENRGKEIGNSMIHPHGQIYSFPLIPKKIEREFNAFLEYEKSNQKCLLCEIHKEELKDGRRIIDENEDFFSEIPYYAHWSFEIHVNSKRHLASIDDFTPREIENFAKIMKKTVQRYDAVIGEGKTMPYVMGMHNAPINVKDRDKFHFHVEFYTPFRGQGKWKFLAGVELGTNTFISDALPRTNAKLMRDILPND
jgi:UDPglucose--hexose-1-phosphate uridylyltransferase